MFARELPEEMLQKMEGADDVPPDFEFDGCTLAIDEFGAIDLVFACCVHDHDYSLFRELFSPCNSVWLDWGPICREQLNDLEILRKHADQRFYRNLIACGASKWLAGLYYRRVRLWGFPLAYEGLPRKVKFWRMVRLFFSRYIPVWVKRTK